jgi:nitrous oxide reductase accessory protein NosL
MNRPLLVVALSTLALAACGQKQEAAAPAAPAPAAVAAPAPAPATTTPAAETTAPVASEGVRPVDVSTLPGEPKLQQR